jgi:hypothetical protein
MTRPSFAVWPPSWQRKQPVDVRDPRCVGYVPHVTSDFAPRAHYPPSRRACHGYGRRDTCRSRQQASAPQTGQCDLFSHRRRAPGPAHDSSHSRASRQGNAVFRLAVRGACQAVAFDRVTQDARIAARVARRRCRRLRGRSGCGDLLNSESGTEPRRCNGRLRVIGADDSRHQQRADQPSADEHMHAYLQRNAPLQRRRTVAVRLGRLPGVRRGRPILRRHNP